MFENLADRFDKTLQNITGKGRISEENIKEALRDVRMALLEADVALPVVRSFMEVVKEKSMGKDVIQSVSPGQAFIKIVSDELTHIMGEANERLNLSTQPPAVILMAGLQGAGKTTSVAKLAKYLKEVEKKTVMVASADVYRPAAIEQLKTLAKEVDVTFFPSHMSEKPVKIAKAAIKAARKQFVDVLLLDTAGRLHIDEQMMAEIKNLHAAVDPIETLFVVDSMTGQDAANTAKAFNEALPLTGVILTKTDGDARGGAALSVRQITGKPIKFLGIGEKVDALQPFHPDRVASRILGMGDVLTLVEEAEQKLDKKETDKLAKKFKKGKKFNLEDFLTQIQQMNNLGGMSSLLDKLPGMGKIPDEVKDKMKDKEIDRLQAIIFSMTKEERRKPDIIKGSRKRRIAAGCGQQVQDVNRLLKQFSQMQKMMKKMRSKGGMAAMMKQMKGAMGGGGGMPF